MTNGPLRGLRVLELPNIGPLQFAGMQLSDMGAEVLRADRKSHVDEGSGLQGPVTEFSLMDRGRRSFGVDLKNPQGVETVKKLATHADVFLEGFRPGVAERLGVGPKVIQELNPRIIYGRMTGWGQEGPWADRVGHDINYISLAGVLNHIGEEAGPPTIPLNLIGDFAGGSMLLVSGVLAALFERQTSGKGQVIDAAMVDGASQLMTIFHTMDQTQFWGERGKNLLDGGTHFYGVFETADGQFLSLASFEPQFYLEFLDVFGLTDLDPADQMNRSQWPELKARVASKIKEKDLSEWDEILTDRDVCYAPVIPMSEARQHPHNVARNSFLEIQGVAQPAPAPRLDRTPLEIQHEPRPSGWDTDGALADWGFGPAEIDDLKTSGAIS